MSEYVSKCCGVEAVPIRTYHYANTIDMKPHIARDPQYGCTKCWFYCEAVAKERK